ncbi:DUF2141 domain-containing protein [Hydrogenophaga sp.]|uniref:DUF2141 domain-containing protein n=1 Tax=Hydrogenophaga sp. TaxID=1904254 RepID=UPI0027374B0D|nr:DUF2141 domain-containing protein [Hydrogenophaga sp.]MDP3888374.1 DUF2141 domain-containing protein [Hydrogenophaga sp.]
MKAVLALAALAMPMWVNAADLRVTVTDGPSGPSTLYLALFDSAEALANNQALASHKVALLDGAAQLVFSGLPVGRYAIKSFADENGNAKLDTNILGMPTERYGFSNNARGRLGPPTFDAAAVQLDADSSIHFRLR